MVNAITPKHLVRQVFSSSTLERIPFIPWICSHAALLEQITVHKMFTDPTQLTKALQNAQRLYNYDAVINIFDPTLEAEACGCPIIWGDNYELPSVQPHPARNLEDIGKLDILEIEKKGRLPIVLEVSQRLKTVLGRNVAIIGVVTGPLTIAASLSGADIIQELEERPQEVESVLKLTSKIALGVCRAYAGLELDVIVVADALIPRLIGKHSNMLRSLLRPIWNVVRFHNAYSILLTREAGLDSLEYLCSMGADGVVAGVSIGPGDPEIDRSQKYNCAFGAAIPPSLLASKDEGLSEYMAHCLKTGTDRRFFLTTGWEVPHHTPPENVHEVMRVLSQTF